MRKEFVETSDLLRSALRLARRRSYAFDSSEAGTMTIFSLFLFLIILAATGIGIDLMRYERDRSKLQSTLDRAVLAAADLDQKLCPRAVVQSYLEKEGLGHYEPIINVNPDNCGEENITPLGFRTVEAIATMEMETQFMHLSGVDELTANATSVAEESIGEVEISLVLDVSGSMGDYSRLDNLQVAANDFVDQMVENTRDGDLSISIIPYATQVAVPDNVMSQFTTEGSNAHANCINFDASEHNSTALNPATERPRTLHMSPWSWYSKDWRPNNEIADYHEICDIRDSREMMVFQKDADTLKNYINALEAKGNTSIDTGLKWGTAMLDSSMNGVIANLAGSAVPSEFDDRPSTYSSGDTLKVLVVMTDGNNTEQAEILDPYRSGPSDVWWNAEEKVYSIYDPDRNQYYWTNRDEWQDHAYGNGTYEEAQYERQCVSWYYYGGCYRYGWVYVGTETVVEGGSAAELDFVDLWERTSVDFVRDMYRDMWGSTKANNYYNSVVQWHYEDEKDTNALALCDAAKDSGVIVYTIAFEAPTEGQTLLAACASSDSHYYDVDGLEIKDAFASIGSSIRKLRLTQ